MTVLSRRAALGGAAAFAAAGCQSLFTERTPDFDEGLTLFIADVHVSGTEPEFAYTRERLAAFVAAVLARAPLPRRVVCFGDLARFHGRREDYALAVSLLKPLSDAGIELTVGLGNHDRHDLFFEHFPDAARRSPVPGAAVSVVPLAHCDLLMLDSLDAAAEGGEGGGRLCKTQQTWLKRTLPAWPRPVIVCAHHDHEELKVEDYPLAVLLGRSPQVKGYVFGHVHRWTTGWYHRHVWAAADHVWPQASLPSLGYWGDIGWAEFRTTPARATLALRQNDFFFPRPVGWGAGGLSARPPEWDDIRASHAHATCTFRLA